MRWIVDWVAHISLVFVSFLSEKLDAQSLVLRGRPAVDSLHLSAG